jgi:rare lipoprotein A
MRKFLALVLVAVGFSGCAHKKNRAARRAPPPIQAPTHTQPQFQPQPGYTETGLASWYGHPYHGRQAADGEIYDMETMVAAHRTLPFQTWVRVVNLKSGKSVDVRIIDRGPFVDGRIIDLSHAAAKAIDLIGPGVAQVSMEVIKVPDAVAPGLYAVQVGAFRVRSNAERLRAEMAGRYGSAQLLQRADTPDLWRVVVGSESTEPGAAALSSRIEQETGQKTTFVVRLN